ncbi:hypothetical protein FOCC_FOCC004154 [Frankliniella occidentalis]|nr:hypothetical protein FOCC_FOCC004154 [Frankliniella occidentalis]
MHGLDLHNSAPWLSPDRISVSHVLVSVVAMRFLACRGSLGARQVGVLLFAVRFYLDALDGEEFSTWALKRFAVMLFILVLLTEVEFRIASLTLGA